MARQMLAHSVRLACLPMVLDAKLCCFPFGQQLSAQPDQPSAMRRGAWFFGNSGNLHKNDSVYRIFRRSSSARTSFNAMKKRNFHLQLVNLPPTETSQNGVKAINCGCSNKGQTCITSRRCRFVNKCMQSLQTCTPHLEHLPYKSVHLLRFINFIEESLLSRKNELAVVGVSPRSSTF
jgi:hypothetical protein